MNVDNDTIYIKNMEEDFKDIIKEQEDYLGNERVLAMVYSYLSIGPIGMINRNIKDYFLIVFLLVICLDLLTK